MRIVFLGTPEFAVPSLAALVEAEHNVVCVVTQPDRPSGRRRKLLPSPIKQLALEHGLPLRQSGDVNAAPFAEELAVLQPDLITVAAFGQKLGPKLLALPTHGCVNVHASLLPRHRGAAPVAHAILAGDTETGVTIMRMAEGIDTGDMLVQGRLPIEPTDTTGELAARLATLGARLLLDAIGQIAGAWATDLTQDNSFATHAPSLCKSDGRVDWTQPADTLGRFVRAMTPWPGAFTFCRVCEGPPLRLVLHDVLPIDTVAPGAAPGTVVVADACTFAVATGHGLLHIRRLQPAGKKPMAAADFLRGHGLEPGTMLGDAT